jgi:hypothetical protein
MTLPELIKEYRKQAIVCSKIDYSDKQSVNANNNAIKIMYGIVDTIKSQFGVDGVEEFAKLLDIKDYNVNVWSATHLLEKMKVGPVAEEKALAIIKNVAKQDSVEGLGFRYWLKDYEAKNIKY